MKKRIFVFGSNLAGMHGAGSARAAVEKYGAEMGVGVGRTGDSYAIPTKDWQIKTLPLKAIEPFVTDFKLYAAMHPELEFEVVRIGCGLAGFTDAQIAPFFADAPANCLLPEGWRSLTT